MSFPLQGQQGTQRSLVHGLRFKSSISPIRLSLVAEGDITAPSSPTNATSPCDTSDAISVYDPTDIDPFKCQARPASSFYARSCEAPSSEGHGSSETSHAMVLSPSSTESLSETTDTFSATDYHQSSAHDPIFSSPETLALKRKTVMEHHMIQGKIRRLFELVRSGSQHLKEMVTLTKDIEDHFIQSSGVITDSESGLDTSIYLPSSTSSPEGLSSPNESFFPAVMPSARSSNGLGLVTGESEIFAPNTPTSTFEGSSTRSPRPSEAAENPPWSPRFRLLPLMIVKKPSLASMSSYTMPPRPTRTQAPLDRLKRSFSSPLFTSHAASSTKAPSEKAIHRASARMSCTPAKRDDIPSASLPTKVDIRFDFEQPDETIVPSPSSRFSSSSTLTPSAVRDRWYKPKFNLSDSTKALRAFKQPKNDIIPSTPDTPSSEPVKSVVGETDERTSLEHSECNSPGSTSKTPTSGGSLPVKASVKLSIGRSVLLAKFRRRESERHSRAGLVLYPTERLVSPDVAALSPPATVLLLPRGPAQIRTAPFSRARQKSDRRLGRFFTASAGIAIKNVTGDPPDSPPSYEHGPDVGGSGALAVSMEAPVECQVHLPRILGMLDDVKDAKKPNGVVRIVSLGIQMSRVSLIELRALVSRGSLAVK